MGDNVRTEQDDINTGDRGSADRDAERGGEEAAAAGRTTPDAGRKGGETGRRSAAAQDGGENVADEANYMGRELDEGRGGAADAGTVRAPARRKDETR